MTVKLLPTLAVSITFCILVSLGLWQIARLKEKTEMINHINKQIEKQPEKLDNTATVDLYKKYSLKGRFLKDKDLFLYGNNHAKPPKAGWHILTPLLTTTGEYIMVNRGWTENKKAPKVSDKEIEIIGMATAPQSGNIFLPKNQPEKNLWIFVDLNEMAKTVGVPIKEDFFITMIDGSTDLLLPSPHDFTRLRNTHLSYAATWLSLAVALLVITYYRAKKS